MTVREFAGNDVIRLSIGELDDFLAGDWSLAAVVYRTSETDYVNIVGFHAGSGNNRGGLWLTDTGLLQIVSSGFDAQFESLDVPLNTWVYIGIDKTAGDEVVGRGHLKNLSANTAMVHEDANGGVNEDTSELTEITIGSFGDDYWFPGLIAGVAALHGATWSDSDHEANAAGFAAMLSSGATDLWPLTQTGDPPAQVVNVVSGRTSVQTNQGTDGTAAVTGSDPPNFNLSLGGGDEHTAEPDDTAAVTDTATAGLGRARGHTDPAAVTDTTAARLGHGRPAADTGTVTDTATPNLTRGRAATDPARLVDTVTASIGYHRAVTDTAHVGDVDEPLTVAIDYTETVTAPAGLTDTVTALVGLAATAADTATVTDTASASAARTRRPADSAALADTVTAATHRARAATDTGGVTDSVDVTAGLAATAADTTAVTDTAGVVAAWGRTAADPAGLTDAVAAARHITVTVTDAAATVDDTTVQVAGEGTAGAGDGAGVTDSVTAVVTRARPVVDATSLTDLVGAAHAAARAVLESAGLTDRLSAAHTAARARSDAARLTDTVTVQLGDDTTLIPARGPVRLLTTTGGVRLL